MAAKREPTAATERVMHYALRVEKKKEKEREKESWNGRWNVKKTRWTMWAILCQRFANCAMNDCGHICANSLRTSRISSNGFWMLAQVQWPSLTP